ncbi:MAG TPA: pseudouridine synthase [Oscillospiraceae bacterium]|nr:hypothetical protein [Oscillospiraceae bacterium]HNW05318.1 pseudouridine synthase [Oscillospiraceae bacterium]
MELFYKDASVIVCDKPAGLLSEGGSGRGAPDLLAKELAARGENPALYPVNRLDREAEGLLLLARDESSAAELSRQVAARLVEKEYLAVVFGEPEEPAGVLRDLLFHDSRKNKTYVADRPRKGVKEAVLRYQTLCTVGGVCSADDESVNDGSSGEGSPASRDSSGDGSANNGSLDDGGSASGGLPGGDGSADGSRPEDIFYSVSGRCSVSGGEKALSLLRIWLETGRTHQIRVQFASRQMPLFGDGKYGGGPGKLALQSHRITFRHPSSGKTVTVSAPYPEGEPWDLFPATHDAVSIK